MHAGVAKYVERLQACKASGTQTRLDAFFASKGPKAVAQGDKFDPFAKKQKKAAAGASSSSAGGKRPVGGSGVGSSGNAAGKKPKR